MDHVTIPLTAKEYIALEIFKVLIQKKLGNEELLLREACRYAKDLITTLQELDHE